MEKAKKLIFYGAGEVAEIAYNYLHNYESLQLIAIIDDKKAGGAFFKYRILDRDKLKRLEFDKMGLGIESIKVGDNIIEIGAESKSYDGKIPDDIVEYLDIIKNRLGIDYYEHESMGTWLRVKFWIDDPDNED